MTSKNTMGSTPETVNLQVITFDCYGTLIDWEKGVTEAMQEILRHHAVQVTPKQLFDCWESVQFEYLQEPYEPYREILYHSLLDTLDQLGIPYQDGDGDRLGNAIGSWLPFAEVPAALQRLRRKFKLGIVSNIDDDILAQTIQHLGVHMDYLVTAERAGFYKPDTEPFRLALEDIGLPPAQILHAAFGYKYDLNPATKMGFKTAFVNRGSLDLPKNFQPTFIVNSLAELADYLLA